MSRVENHIFHIVRLCLLNVINNDSMRFLFFILCFKEKN